MEQPKQSEIEGCDKLMAKYNFDSPIEVNLVIEEEDPPEPELLKVLLLSKNTNAPNTNVCEKSSKVYKRTDSNIDNVENKMLNAKKNYISKSVVEESNHSISVSKTVFPEGHQEDSQDIEWKLLDAVADNLIHITKYYYYNFITSKKRMINYKKLIHEYLALKHYFFDLSYSTTIAILLPQENNIPFLKSFIHRVINIAYRSSRFKIPYKMLGILMRDMFVWTKLKKTNLDLKFGSHNRKSGDMDCSFSAVTISNKLNQSRQNLNSSFDNNPVTNHASQGSQTQPDIVSETHPPVEIISISPNIRRITSYSTQDLTSPLNITTKTNYTMQDANISTSSGYLQNNTDCRINNLTQGITSMPYISAKRNYSTETNNFSSRQALKTNTSKIILFSGPPNQEIIISVDTETLANINYQNTNQINNNSIECHVNEAYGITSTKRKKTNDGSYYACNYSNSFPHQTYNNIHYNKNNTANLKLPVDDPRCDDSSRAGYKLFNTSTSSDKMCLNPLYASFRNKQRIENEEQETQVISNVTSMNPNAVRFA